MQAIQKFLTWFEKQKPAGKLVIGCAGLVLLCCICSVPIGLLNPSKSTPEVTRTIFAAVPTETTAAVVSPTGTLISPTIAPSPTEKVKALLPGLMPADVTVNLKQRGFTCGSVEQGQLYYVRTCEKDTADYSLRVDTYGREAFTIDLIESSVLQFTNPDKEFAASFLGFMATMPYDGAVQQEARDWVESTLPTLTGQGDVREKVFAGVHYRLYGIPTAYTLEMGDLP